MADKTKNNYTILMRSLYYKVFTTEYESRLNNRIKKKNVILLGNSNNNNNIIRVVNHVILYIYIYVSFSKTQTTILKSHLTI